jgi:hypothetical protein
MRKSTIFLIAFTIMMLGCAWFIPKTNPEGRHQAPAVSCYTEIIEGHKYVIVVATNNTDSYMASHSCCPSISVSVVHAESCPCIKEKKDQTITVERSNGIFD